MAKHVTLVFGSSIWLIGIATTFIVGAIILFFSKRVDAEKLEKVRIALIILFTINFFSFQVYAALNGSWRAATSLPLHLCSLSQIFGIYALITKNQFAFEFAAFFGIAGGINSLFTPEFAHGYDRFYHVQYYFEHGGIVLMPLFLGIAYSMKPRMLSWLKVMVTANILAFIMYFLNNALSSNYMYVNIKPIADNPFLIGPWPYYIFMLELVAVVHFYAIYICFHRFKKWA